VTDQNFEAIPALYIQADRSLFVNCEYLLQLDDVDNPDTSGKGRYWYVDVLAFEPKNNIVWLCEFTFSREIQSLRKRLAAWADHWASFGAIIQRDSGLKFEPLVRPWAFVPETCLQKMVHVAEITGFDGNGPLPPIKITPLEMTLPWNYRFWKRDGEGDKPSVIPQQMRE
jgi:hypothetical protein